MLGNVSVFSVEEEGEEGVLEKVVGCDLDDGLPPAENIFGSGDTPPKGLKNGTDQGNILFLEAFLDAPKVDREERMASGMDFLLVSGFLQMKVLSDEASRCSNSPNWSPKAPSRSERPLSLAATVDAWTD